MTPPFLPSRRSFLAGAFGAVAAPWILPSRVWAADTGGNSRINVGVMGVGMMSTLHLKVLLPRDDIQIVAVCDVDTNRREYAKANVEKHYAAAMPGGAYKGCTAYNDFRELLARKDIDVVINITPDHWHAFIGIAAVQAGKDVYGEKPLTHNVHEALKLTQAVRDTDRIFQTGSQQRSSKEFRIASELVRNGVIGDLKTITTYFTDPAPPYYLGEEPMEPGLDWDMWCGPGPLKPYNSVLSPRGIPTHFPNWRNTREFGGGRVTDWGAHHIDIAQWAMDCDATGPVEVRSPGLVKTRGAQLVYANGVVLTHNEGKGVSFYGSDGEVHVNRNKFELFLGGKRIHGFLDKETDKGVSLDRVLALTERDFLQDAKIKLRVSKNHFDDFFDSVRRRQKPICDVAIGAATAISCHLMNMAYNHGASFQWDPQDSTFTQGGDPKWLTREYRGPWVV